MNSNVVKGQLTVWMRGADRTKSGHVGGGSMTNREWLLAETSALQAKGQTVKIVENPKMPGWFALVRV